MKKTLELKWTVIVFCITFMASCSSEQSTLWTRDKILKLNPALQRVLDCYRHDEEKLRAAEFLIDNLPYHEGVAYTDLEPQRLAYELFGTGKYTQFQARDSVIRRYGYWGVKNPYFQSDVYINPDYLIDNIDWAFKVWKEQPWGKSVSFEQFCEYILPYRLGNEELIPWREKVYNQFQPIIDALPNDSNKMRHEYVITVLLDSLLKQPVYFTGEISSEIRPGPRVVDYLGGSCLDLSDKMAYICRALGIPCCIDCMPMRGDNNAPHYINSIEDAEGRNYYFSLLFRKNRVFHCALLRDSFGKMYRQTFSVNKEMLEQAGCSREELHPIFHNPCIKDVTALYTRKGCADLKLSQKHLFETEKTGGLFYLCMSNRMSWVPVDFARFIGDTITFGECHGGVLYCVGKYDPAWQELTMVTDPFWLEKDTSVIRFLSPGEETEDVVLFSKFGMVVEPYIWRMKDGVFEGSNTLSFGRADTLYKIPAAPQRLCTQVEVNNPKAYRYLRYKGADGSYCNVSEVVFYAADNMDTPLTGKIIGPVEGKSSWRPYTNVYDGQTDTSYDHPFPNGGWAGLALDKPVRVGKIVYTPRNRDNFVRPGDTYELLVFEEGEWVSHEMQVAVADSLVYHDIPKHALLILRNHTRGVAERVFEYKDGRQEYR